MDLFKIFRRKKDYIADTGLNLLRRITSPEFTKSGMIQQYSKSLYVFACISKIAEKVAATELKLYKILNSKGDTKEIITHPVLDLLYKVNPFQTKTEFLEITMINLKTTGDAFWFKTRNNSGKVVELWNLRPDYMEIIKDPVNFIKEYKFTTGDGTTESFVPEDIVHIKYSNPMDMYFGLSPIKAAQIRVQTEDFASRYQRDFFLNSSRPDAVIKNKGESVLRKETRENIRRDWNIRHQGVGNSSKIAILDENLDYQQISLTQKEMDYIESMKFTRDDILVAFKVPKPIVAITDDVNRANAETAMYIFLSETIVPEIRRLIEKINEELIYPDFGEEFFMGFVDPTPANRVAITDEYVKAIQNNWLLINEVRAMENLPPIKGGWSFYMPLVNSPMGGLPQADQKGIEGLKKKLLKLYDDARTITEKEPERYNFKGRFWLKQKFIIMETVTETVGKVLSGKSKGKSKKIKTGKPMIEDKEMKKAYALMILKIIDAKAEKLKDGMTKFAIEQKDRVLAELNKTKSKAKRKELKVSQIFDKKTEEGLAIDFIIPYLEAYLKEAGADALDMIAPQEDFQTTQEIKKKIKKRAELFAESVNNTTLGKLDATLAEGISAGEGIRDLGNRVESVYEDFSIYRSELIARTEATAANNEGLLEGYRQSDVANAKEWINAGDDRVRPEHQEGTGVGGEIVALDDAFSNGLQYPQEPNCRCVLGPAFLE
jgi:HK97 family phage portal protein